MNIKNDELVKSRKVYLFEIITKYGKISLAFFQRFGMKSLNNQKVKGKIMMKVKNPNQLNIFDP